MSTLPAQGIPVQTPSGGIFYLLTAEEARYFEDRSKRYTLEYRYSDVSDLQDVDRLLIMETMVWRWGLWLSREQDYWGAAIDSNGLKRHVGEYAKEIRQLKKLMGMDATSRQKSKGESIADLWDNLCKRAKEFGVHRNDQAIEAITLFMEIRDFYTTMNNCTPDEQQENNCTPEKFIEWIGTHIIPKFEELEADGRARQALWIREV